MKVSFSWLRKYVPVEMDPPSLADALTMAGLEAEGISDRYDYLNTVLVGRITGIKPHPNADRLKICTVDLGSHTATVVCGAPNARESLFSPCALPGTSFPNGNTVKTSVIRGVESEGMLCSEGELLLGPECSGIMELKGDLPLGKPLHQAIGLSDPVIEIDLTPNRPDCLSIIGIAREVAAIQNKKVTYPEIRLPDAIDHITDFTSVTILDPDLCSRYAAQLLFGITVAPSPQWLQERLISVGLKPINNIVDITNFVMMETGQPLHAFDFDRLSEKRIVVRRATHNEKFSTLDRKERSLSQEMLLICDGEKPVALAGVMGGLNSEIEESTTRVLIESACFDPVSIRKTSKKMGLSTDASHRFERGVDPDGTVFALHRAAQLMAEVSGGTLINGHIDNHPKPAPPKAILLSVKYTNRLLGMDITQAEIKKYLQSIEFKTEAKDSDTLIVIPPSFRVDVKRPEDLMEEVARLAGYNNIRTSYPMIPAKDRTPSKEFMVRNRIKDLMTGLGFTETINYSFIGKPSSERLGLKADDPRRGGVEIRNPLTEEQSVMRTSLIPGLLETLHRNMSRQVRDLKIFEIGKIFLDAGKEVQPTEIMMMAGLWSGRQTDVSWHFKERSCDFYDIKGVVEGLFTGLSVKESQFTQLPVDSCCYTKPGHTAQISIQNQAIGLIGEIAPQVLDNFDLKQTAFIFELTIDQLHPFISEIRTAKPLPKFPSVTRDITLIISKMTETGAVLRSVEEMKESLVESLCLFDVYDDAPVPKGKKSVSFRIVYRSSEKTLEDEAVNSLHAEITQKIIRKFDARLPA